MLRFVVGSGVSSGKPSWWLLDDDGTKVAWAGSTYDTIEQARDACMAFRAGSAGWRYEIYMDSKDQPRWRAKDGRKKVGASGGPFASKMLAVNDAHRMRSDTRYAIGP